MSLKITIAECIQHGPRNKLFYLSPDVLGKDNEMSIMTVPLASDRDVLMPVVLIMRPGETAHLHNTQINNSFVVPTLDFDYSVLRLNSRKYLL